MAPVRRRPLRPAGAPRAGRRRVLAAAAVVLVAVAVALLVLRPAPDDPADPGPRPVAAEGSLDAAALVGAVTHRRLSSLDGLRLAPGLVPPTNRWFGALVFGAEGPRPVFPRPLSFALTGPGFSVGVPTVRTTADSVLSRHEPAVTVDVGADRAVVGGYDDTGVTVDLLDAAGATVAQVVLVQGSPLVSLRARAALTVTTDVPFTAPPDDADGTPAPATARARGRSWAQVAVTAPGAPGGPLRLAAGDVVTWYPLPDDVGERGRRLLAEAARDPVVATRATGALDPGRGVAATTLELVTAGGGPTVHTTLPHHRRGEQPERDCGLGTYPSALGTLELCAGARLRSWAPLLRPTARLDLTDVTAAERAAILDRLERDVASTGDVPPDTYFGGKALYRAATLVTLGEDLGADAAVAPLRRRTAEALRTWAQPDGCAVRDERCFAYDPGARGVVGLRTAFGSEEFNDHHFHHGYHLAAAGLLAADDPALRADLRPVLDLLVLDVAAPEATRWFPRLRHLDRYEGHSWASGTSPFDNGPNAESSSEAVHAWNGVGLWARATGRADLADHAAWLLSTEAAAARAYWTDLDRDDPVHAGYAHTVVGIVWGAKRDHATFFSEDPAAVLGIQLLPMGPVAGHLPPDPGRIRAQLAEAAPSGRAGAFADYLLMYRSLAGPDDARAAWDEALTLAGVDDANSRAYTLAFIAARDGTVADG